MSSDNKNIVVIGGAGYIGTAVVAELLEHGYEVTVYDRLIFGREPLQDFIQNKQLHLVQGDLFEESKLVQACQESEAVIHMAGIVGDPACAIDPDVTKRINIEATKQIKRIVEELHIPRLIYTSSCSVYGSTEKKVDEKSNLNPVSLYAQTKIESEKILINNDATELHCTILRLATVFGHSRRPRFDLIANLFTAQAYQEGRLTVTGSNQLRPFIHVKDIARAVVQVIQAPLRTIDKEICNVGDERMNMSIGDLARLVQKVVKRDRNGKKVEIIHKDDKSDKRNYAVSFQKIKDVLGFEATITLEQGIEEMYQYLKQNRYRDYHEDIYHNVKMMDQIIKEYHNL